ncbi:hypothetical protein L195_g025473 [Trifolium pratense]|uniref:Uncharacterized protein n=1 Tax=Trifolium pratense TaxID=57577 RepID=A0A2K3NGJ7_TRIPR|nr:hypothetical protein L195_g025473 [Trifolium pratense]
MVNGEANCSRPNMSQPRNLWYGMDDLYGDDAIQEEGGSLVVLVL